MSGLRDARAKDARNEVIRDGASTGNESAVDCSNHNNDGLTGIRTQLLPEAGFTRCKMSAKLERGADLARQFLAQQSQASGFWSIWPSGIRFPSVGDVDGLRALWRPGGPPRKSRRGDGSDYEPPPPLPFRDRPGVIVPAAHRKQNRLQLFPSSSPRGGGEEPWNARRSLERPLERWLTGRPSLPRLLRPAPRPSPRSCVSPPALCVSHNLSKAGRQQVAPRGQPSFVRPVVKGTIFEERTLRLCGIETVIVAYEDASTSSSDIGPRWLSDWHARLPPIRTVIHTRQGRWTFASGNRAGRCRWSAGVLGDLPLPPPLHSGAAPYSLGSPSLALKTTMLREITGQLRGAHRRTSCLCREEGRRGWPGPGQEIEGLEFRAARRAPKGAVVQRLKEARRLGIGRRSTFHTREPVSATAPYPRRVAVVRTSAASLPAPCAEDTLNGLYPPAASAYYIRIVCSRYLHAFWIKHSKNHPMYDVFGFFLNMRYGQRSEADLQLNWGRGGVAVRLLASHLSEPVSVLGGVAPVFPLVGIVSDDAACQWVFSGISSFLRPCIPELIHSHFTLPSSTLKTSMLRAPPDLSAPLQPNIPAEWRRWLSAAQPIRHKALPLSLWCSFLDLLKPCLHEAEEYILEVELEQGFREVGSYRECATAGRRCSVADPDCRPSSAETSRLRREGPMAGRSRFNDVAGLAVASGALHRARSERRVSARVVALRSDARVSLDRENALSCSRESERIHPGRLNSSSIRHNMSESKRKVKCLKLRKEMEDWRTQTERLLTLPKERGRGKHCLPRVCGINATETSGSGRASGKDALCREAALCSVSFTLRLSARSDQYFGLTRALMCVPDPARSHTFTRSLQLIIAEAQSGGCARALIPPRRRFPSPDQQRTHSPVVRTPCTSRRNSDSPPDRPAKPRSLFTRRQGRASKVTQRRVIDGKAARQFSGLRLEAMRELMRMPRSPLALGVAADGRKVGPKVKLMTSHGRRVRTGWLVLRREETSFSGAGPRHTRLFAGHTSGRYAPLPFRQTEVVRGLFLTAPPLPLVRTTVTTLVGEGRGATVMLFNNASFFRGLVGRHLPPCLRYSTVSRLTAWRGSCWCVRRTGARFPSAVTARAGDEAEVPFSSFPQLHTYTAGPGNVLPTQREVWSVHA
ncbi:hypothetical protein PR048_025693 [Dryococelus australis]|uniref:Uncharacterized protein n=1 Tax=Dryococelus australis TaxID=614101 RepID=A0ABQ9GJ98_9NEOP|nr:hypothetical protein PR048_025693 [Dryococelus australis]